MPNKNFPLVKLRTFSSLLGRGFTRLLFDEQTLNPNHMWKFIAHSHQQLFHNEKRNYRFFNKIFENFKPNVAHQKVTWLKNIFILIKSCENELNFWSWISSTVKLSTMLKEEAQPLMLKTIWIFLKNAIRSSPNL